MTLVPATKKLRATVRRPLRIVPLVLLFGSQSGCVHDLAVGAFADALSASGGTYGSDDDPELVKEAVPFGLKTMESVLVERPEHVGLLTALAAGFTQYAYAFVQDEADALVASDVGRAELGRARARRLYLRAKAYGMRGLEVRRPGVAGRLTTQREAALDKLDREDVPLLYWTAAAWGLAIGTSLSDTRLIAEYPEVEALARRALVLDEAWNRGAIHELFIALESSSPSGDRKRAREHFARAVALSEGHRAGPFVTLAEKVSVKEQNAREFHALLDQALAIDVDRYPDDRLANVIAQRRARRLKQASGELFLEDVPAS